MCIPAPHRHCPSAHNIEPVKCQQQCTDSGKNVCLITMLPVSNHTPFQKGGNLAQSMGSGQQHRALQCWSARNPSKVKALTKTAMRVSDALPTAKSERGQGREDASVPSQSLLSPQHGADHRVVLSASSLRSHRNTAYRLHVIFSVRFSVRSCRFVVFANFLHQPPLRNMPPKSSKKSWRKRTDVTEEVCRPCLRALCFGLSRTPLVLCEATEAAQLCEFVRFLALNLIRFVDLQVEAGLQEATQRERHGTDLSAAKDTDLFFEDKVSSRDCV